MVGTLVNVGAILLGGSVGLVFRSAIPKKYITIVFQGIGLFTLFIGVDMALKTNNYLILVMSIVAGAILGTLLKIEQGVNKLSDLVAKKSKSDSNKFSEGMVSAFLLYCMGSMTILGAFQEGLGDSPDLLLAKSLMDGVSSVALAAGLGYGVLFSVVPLLIYQGGLTIFAQLLSNHLTENVINELTAVGGLLLIGMGLNILEITKIKILDMLPALIIVVALVFIFV